MICSYTSITRAGSAAITSSYHQSRISSNGVHSPKGLIASSKSASFTLRRAVKMRRSCVSSGAVTPMLE